MAFASLGIVFGDIGTSPLYAFESSIHSTGLPPGRIAIFGVASLIFWTLNIIVGIKYLVFITRVDNDGDGGVFALVAPLKSKLPSAFGQLILISIVMLSVALLFADSVITTPLSIMAAVEGISTVNIAASNLVIPICLTTVALLFFVQQFGSSALSVLFSPIMLIWFGSIGLLGLSAVCVNPEILLAVSPFYALELVSALTWTQLLALFGSVLLAATGAEAIYADMGHFGRKPIAIAWYLFAIGALLLSYFGQSALLLNAEAQVADPFFQLVPDDYKVSMIVLATLASFIAGQAMISGMFSIVNQAISQGYFPRLKVIHTSDTVRGQIFIPVVNGLLFLGAIVLILTFQSSESLASSYGFAVATTMLLTTIAFCLVLVLEWKWTAPKLIAFLICILPLDLLFVSAAITKLPSGYYFTPIITLSFVLCMVAWQIGNRLLAERAQRIDLPVRDFSELIGLRKNLYKQNRPAVFFQHLSFSNEARITPFVLLQQVQVTSMLYQPTVVVEFVNSNLPRIEEAERVSLVEYPHKVIFVHVTFGYRESWSIDPVIKLGKSKGWWAREEEIVYYSARESLLLNKKTGLPLLFKLPYAILHRLDQRIFKILKLDPVRSLEVATNVEI